MCDCIIPYFNEDIRPLYVVDSLLKIKNINKIITIDDGSFDNFTYLAIKSKFPQIICIRLEKNQGKAYAVKEGFKYLTTDYVMLFDGDLTNIKTQEIDTAIEKITNNKQIDMLLLRRVEDKTVTFSRFFRHDIIFTGQRILKRNDLEKILVNNVSGYGLELIINRYMISNRKKVYWMPSSVHNLFKQEKWGYKKGLFIKGILETFSLLYRPEGIYQTLFFCREKAL